MQAQSEGHWTRPHEYSEEAGRRPDPEAAGLSHGGGGDEAAAAAGGVVVIVTVGVPSRRLRSRPRPPALHPALCPPRSALPPR